MVFVKNFRIFFQENIKANFGLLGSGCYPEALKIFEGWEFFTALKIFQF